MGGMCGWGFILFEIFMGSAGKGASEEVTDAVKQSFSNMRLIVLAGWAIYPAGYMALLVASGPETSKALNVIYNIADFTNKIGFVLACCLAPRVRVRRPRQHCLHELCLQFSFL